MPFVLDIRCLDADDMPALLIFVDSVLSPENAFIATLLHCMTVRFVCSITSPDGCLWSTSLQILIIDYDINQMTHW